MRRRVGWEARSGSWRFSPRTAIVAAVAVTAALGAHQADTRRHRDEDHDRRHVPAHGPASLYKTIPAAEKAYFAYVNDHGGVNGRKIDFKVLDDGYDPSKTVPLTQQLVEQDKVFAIFGSLGTAPNLSTWGYLNTHKVPQVLIATGDSYWGFCRTSVRRQEVPVDDRLAAGLPGRVQALRQVHRLRTCRNAKIGVLYQNDSYGKNYYAGLRVGLGAKKSNIVSAQSYDADADER